MKNLKALSIALLLGTSAVSLPLCAADQLATSAPANSEQQATLKNIEKHLEYLAADVRFKNYLVVGAIGLSFVSAFVAAAANAPRR